MKNQTRSTYVNQFTFILALCSFFMLQTATAQNRNRKMPTPTGPSVMLKLNATQAISGIYSGGLELREGKRTSFFVDAGWIHKNNKNIATEGFGVEGGMRLYTNLNKRIRKGKAQGKFANFSGNYFSFQGRYGELRDLGSESTGFDYAYKKVAIHYGMQRAWNHLFFNFEFGPSFGNSDFDHASNGHFERYYLNNFNIDTKVTLGFAF